MRSLRQATVFLLSTGLILAGKLASAETSSVENAPTRAADTERAALYEEDPSTPYGKSYSGTVVWRIEGSARGSSQRSELAIGAYMEVPERKFAMTWLLRRNNDPTLPASHVVEMTFNLPADFPSGNVAYVPGITMKAHEQRRGVALRGNAVKVNGGLFRLDLSNVGADRRHNLELLNQRDWFDIAMVYGNKQRALLAVDKGAAGARMFNKVLAAWGQDHPVQPASPPK
jgi:hypothetical protein